MPVKSRLNGAVDIFLLLLLPAEATAVLFSASSVSFFSVNTITGESLHLA